MLREDNYAQIKRWEKSQQLKTLQNENFSGPLALCPYRDHSGEIVSLPVFIVRMYQKELCCVKPCLVHSPLLQIPPYWITRQGIDWENYLPAILKAYRYDAEVPSDFVPLRKISETLLANFEKLLPRQLPEVFQKMRDNGLLRKLDPLLQNTYPSVLNWANRKMYFQDFRKKT